MLKVLLKKQLSESFRFIYFDDKKNKKRSKGGIAGWIIFYAFILVGCLSASFASTAVGLCKPLADAGAGWLFFAIMSVIAVFAGACGSIFSTFSGLYLPKDNDLLLSMPIPVNKIIFSRLLNVYIMGAVYASTAMIPSLIIYWAMVKFTFSTVICGIILFLITTFIVLLLSCLLGWIVAMISLRLKHKSVFTVIISLLFLGLYYFFYFKAGNIISQLIANAGAISQKIKNGAYILYFFGSIGEGNWISTAICFCVIAAVSAALWIGISKTFISIATASGKNKTAKYKEKTTKQNPLFFTLLKKEAGRFASSANYMLNCGFGVIFIIALAVSLIIKGKSLETFFVSAGLNVPEMGMALATIAICLASEMVVTSVPSVSLEGKNVWILQSLPIDLKYALFAKAALEFILSAVPSLIAVICAQFVFNATVLGRVLSFALILAYLTFKCLFGTFLAIKMPNLNWTNEQVPIKQAGNVFISLVVGIAVPGAVGLIFLAAGNYLSWWSYAAIWTAVFIGLSALLASYLSKKGGKEFSELT